MTSSYTSSSSSNFMSVVKKPCFISSHNGVQKLISFLCVAREKLQRGSCVEKSYDGTHLAFGGTLDRRCHFKHVSLKAGSTTVKQARLTAKGSRSSAVCHNRHKKFPRRPTRDVSLLSGHASYMSMSNEVCGAGAKLLHAKREWCQVNRTRPLVLEKCPELIKISCKCDMDRQADKHYEANSHFSRFCECA
jgi:hypothetical protein